MRLYTHPCISLPLLLYKHTRSQHTLRQSTPTRARGALPLDARRSMCSSSSTSPSMPPHPSPSDFPLLLLPLHIINTSINVASRTNPHWHRFRAHLGVTMLCAPTLCARGIFATFRYVSRVLHTFLKKKGDSQKRLLARVYAGGCLRYFRTCSSGVLIKSGHRHS